MGHKVNPIGLRLGINRTWDSRWFAGADYAKLLHEDLKLRNHLRLKLRGAGVSRVGAASPLPSTWPGQLWFSDVEALGSALADDVGFQAMRLDTR